MPAQASASSLSCALLCVAARAQATQDCVLQLERVLQLYCVLQLERKQHKIERAVSALFCLEAAALAGRD